MAIRYDLSATELLNYLEYDTPAKKERLEKFLPKGVPLPKVYRDFIEVAFACPLLRTADIWVGGEERYSLSQINPYFLYEEIEESIEEQKEDWLGDPEGCEDNAYYPFSKIPKERWQDLVDDYLEIGSDYGAGVVTFGIRKQDLTEDDPPVWMNHEADPITEWKKMYETVSDYLLDIVLLTLTCETYHTALDELEKKGWEYRDYEEEGEYFEEDNDSEWSIEEYTAQILDRVGVDFKQVHRHYSGIMECDLFCCYEEEKHCFYLGKIEEEKITLFQIGSVSK